MRLPFLLGGMFTAMAIWLVYRGAQPRPIEVLAHKLEQAALAPAAPSSQDEYVANQAAQMAAEARRAEEAQNRQQLYNAAGGGHIDTFA